MAYRQYLDTRHYNMPWKNVAISGLGAELPLPLQEAVTASMATEIQRLRVEGRNFTLAIGAIVLGLGLVIDHFLDKRRMTPNRRRRAQRRRR